MNKFFFLLFVFLGTLVFSQTPKKVTLEMAKANVNPTVLDCSPARDSCAKKSARGELGFYKGLKLKPGAYCFIAFGNSVYTKTELPKNSITPSFAYCFNNEMKNSLDSFFKTDFLHKNDSILAAFDKQGRGYRKVDFPGGKAGIDRFLEKNMVFTKPVKSDNDNPEISITYNLLINEKGGVSDIKELESNCKEASIVLLSVIKKMPAFTTGTEAGVIKKSWYTLVYIKK